MSCAALGALGCASAEPDPADARVAELERQIQSMERNKAKEHGDLKRQLEVAVDEAKAQERASARMQRELTAARQTKESQRITLDASLALLAKREKELAALKRQAKTPQTAQEATKLLLAVRRENRRLRNELVRLKAGETKAVPSGLEKVVTAAGLDLERPVARIDGRIATRRTFMEFLYRDLGAPHLLKLFVNRYLVLREARRRKMSVSAIEREVWTSKQIAKHEKEAGGRKKLTQKLQDMGYTRAAWEARLRYQAEPSLLLARMVQLSRRTKAGKRAWQARIREEYEQTYSEQITASHVLIACPAEASPARVKQALVRADAAYRQIKSGTPFAKVAGYYSDDKASRGKQGGSLGRFDRHKFASLPRFNSALFTLPKGVVSRPIRSRAGFHVLLVEKRHPPAKPFSAEVKRALAARLEQEPPSRGEVEVLLDRLRARAKVETALVFD